MGNAALHGVKRLFLASFLVPWVGACAPASPGDPLSPAARPVLDGTFDEWAGVPVLSADPDDPRDDPQVDLVLLRATDDPAWLYLQLELEGALNLQAMPGTLTLLVDSDGDPATGGAMEGETGFDLAIRMSPKRTPESDYGAGTAVSWSGRAEISPYELGVAALPTHSSDRFELRVARDGSAVRTASDLGPLPGGGSRADAPRPRLGARIRVALVVRAGEDDEVVDRIPPAAYSFATARGPDPFLPRVEPLAPPQVPDSLGAAPRPFRVATLNVGEWTFRNPEPHARLLAAVQPDIILLDEVYEDISSEVLQGFFARPGLASLGDWSFVISRGGGRQKTVVAARDRRVRQEPTMAEVAYAPGTLDALRRQVDSSFHRNLDYEARTNLSATGAWVELGGQVEALFVPVDFQSAGHDGSPRDILRLLQAGTVMRHVMRATAAGPENAPVVVAGDLNLVGSRAPLGVLLADRRNPFGPLAVAELPRLDEATWTTWRNPGQDLFTPGRLDYTLYSRETLRQVGGFVFAVDQLTDAQLATLGLDRSLGGAMDHLIMVADFEVRDDG